MKSIWKSIKDTVVSNVLWIAILSIPSAVFCIAKFGEISSLLINNQNVPGETWFWVVAGCIVCFISSIFCLVFSVMYCINKSRAKKAKDAEPTLPLLDRDYKIINAEFEIYFKDRHNITARKYIKFEVLADFLEEVNHRMTWTGQEYLNSELDEASRRKGYELTDSDRESSPHFVKIRFPEKLHKGQGGHYVFETRVRDVKQQMIPYLARLVKAQTEHLTLRVTSPENMIKSVRGAVSADQARDIVLQKPVEIAPKRIGDLVSYDWEIGDTELLRNYYLEWEFM